MIAGRAATSSETPNAFLLTSRLPAFDAYSKAENPRANRR
jgi:hypothetical protein